MATDLLDDTGAALPQFGVGASPGVNSKRMRGIWTFLKAIASGGSGSVVKADDASTVNGLTIGVPTAFTPTLIGSSVTGSQTYSAQYGEYIKTGQLVHVEGFVQITAKGGTMAGNVQIGGLPFAHKSSGTGRVAGAIITEIVGVTFDSGKTWIAGEIQPGESVIRLVQNGSGANAAYLPVANIAAATIIQFAADYISA